MKSIFSGFRRFAPACLLAAAAVCAVPGLLQAQTPQAALPLVGHTPRQVVDGTAIRLGHYEPTQMLRLAIALTPPHLAEEHKFVEDVQDKQSPLFHRYLTVEQWRDRFGPSAEDEQAVVDWAKSQGLTVTQRYPNRLLVDVEAPAGTIEKALGVTINSYRLPAEHGFEERTAFSNDRDPALPARLSGVVQLVAGLDSVNILRPNGGSGRLGPMPDYVPGPVKQEGESARAAADPEAVKALAAGVEPTPQVTPPPSGGLTPATFLASSGYDYSALMNLGHCCNPLNNANNSPPTSSIVIAAYGDVSLNDIAGWHQAFPYLAYNFQKQLIDGGYSCNNSPNPDTACVETTLDTEWSFSMANSENTPANTAKVIVYEGVNSNGQTRLDEYNFILNDGFARVMSTSWGGPEGLDKGTIAQNNAEDNVLTEMVGEGWTLLAASGDQGATAACDNGLDVAYPASDPNVVGVGGTRLTENASAGYEVAWTGRTTAGACAANGGGSTGGFSDYWGVPAYQNGMTYNHGVPFGFRAVPDMALDAAGGEDVYYNGGWLVLGGTSIAAPKLAGFFAQENAYLLAIGNKCGTGASPCAPIGNANWYLYREGTNPDSAHIPYYDIVSGCNSNDITLAYGLTAWCATTGFDEVTGWGSANMLQLAWALNWRITAANGLPSIKFVGPAVNKWYNTDQQVSWSVTDYAGNVGAPPTGIAGQTAGWDSIPPDSRSMPYGGNAQDSFYLGPAMPNTSIGCLSFSGSGCIAGIGTQGCHTAHVMGWNNQGGATGDSKYGPICYDSVAPTLTATLLPTKPASGWFNYPVQLTFNAADPGGRNASGIAKVFYGLNNPNCSNSNTFACGTYANPLNLTTQGANVVVGFAMDQAGNFSNNSLTIVQIDTTAPVTTASYGGTASAGNWTTAVTVTLSATDALSGVKTTRYYVDNGASAAYTAPFKISAPGTHRLIYWSMDVAGNTESSHTFTFNIVSATSISMSVSPNPASSGQAVTLTATVTAAIAGNTPVGTVSFYNGKVLLGTSQVLAGAATLTTTSLPIGKDSVGAIYNPGAGYTTSASRVLTETILQGSTTTLTASPSSPAYGQSVTLTATVKSASSGTPTGSVQFMDGYFNTISLLGTATLNSSGVATFTTTALQGSNNSLTAAYSGDAQFGASTSATKIVTVTAAASSTALKVSAGSASHGQTVTLTATVTSKAGTPPGQVTFKANGGSVGSASLSGGVATLQVAFLPVGTDAITANYAGTYNFAGSVSAPFSIVVSSASGATAPATLAR